MSLVLAQASDTLPDDNSGYVAAAYLVFFALAIIYFGIMAVKLQRLERDLVELNELADKKVEQLSPTPAPTPAATTAGTASTIAAEGTP